MLTTVVPESPSAAVAAPGTIRGGASSSSARRKNTSRNSLSITSLKALRMSGRVSVTRAVWSAVSTRTVS